MARPDLTADTITDDEIRALRAEATAAGDEAMASACTTAITPCRLPHDAPADHHAMAKAARSVRELARACCADAINAARAMKASRCVFSEDAHYRAGGS